MIPFASMALPMLISFSLSYFTLPIPHSLQLFIQNYDNIWEQSFLLYLLCYSCSLLSTTIGKALFRPLGVIYRQDIERNFQNFTVEKKSGTEPSKPAERELVREFYYNTGY